MVKRKKLNINTSNKNKPKSLNEFFNQTFVQARAHLLNQSPYYAYMLLQCGVIEDEDVHTISILEKEGAVYIKYSPKWIDTLTLDQASEAIKHVLLHLIFGHVEQGKKKGDDEEDLRFELSKDLAVNTNLNNGKLPKGFICPKHMKLPENLSSSEYYTLLPENKEEIRKKIKTACLGDGDMVSKKGIGKPIPGSDKPGDNHREMKSEVGSNQLQHQVQNMAQQAHSKAGGKLPSGWGDGAFQFMKLLLAPPEIPWATVLRRFLLFASQIKTKLTWKRINKRFGDIVKGRQKIQTLKILVAVDESGSISDTDWRKFMSEIEGIFKTGAAIIDICKFTAVVETHYIFKGMDKEKVGRFNGGTNFQPVFDYAEETRPDAIVFLTDGWNFDSPVHYNKGNSVLWVITTDGALKEKFGSTIQMKKSDDFLNKELIW